MARKVLVIDDERDSSNVMLARLYTHGFDVISANDGESGFEKARKYLPDFILLDIKIPGWSGVITANRLENNPGTANIPIIFLTGLCVESTAMNFLKNGDYHSISKPFIANELLTILANNFGM